MRHIPVVLIAAALIAAPAGAAAQRAAAQLRFSRGAHTDRRHATIPDRSQNAVLRFGATLGAPRMHTAMGRLPDLRMTRTASVRLSWSATDVALAGAFTAALLIDAGQTRGLARGGWQGYRETNPILGARPSVGDINTYTAVSGLAVLGAAAVLPARLRPWLLSAALAVETFTIAGTVREGVAIRIP